MQTSFLRFYSIYLRKWSTTGNLSLSSTCSLRTYLLHKRKFHWFLYNDLTEATNQSTPFKSPCFYLVNNGCGMWSSDSRTILIIRCYYTNNLLRFDWKSWGNGRKCQNKGRASVDLEEINLQRWTTREASSMYDEMTTPPSSLVSKPVPGSLLLHLLNSRVWKTNVTWRMIVKLLNVDLWTVNC